MVYILLLVAIILLVLLLEKKIADLEERITSVENI